MRSINTLRSIVLPRNFMNMNLIELLDEVIAVLFRTMVKIDEMEEIRSADPHGNQADSKKRIYKRSKGFNSVLLTIGIQ